MKTNWQKLRDNPLGALRYMTLRTMQIVVYSSVILHWFGAPAKWMLFGGQVFIGATYALIDYLKIIEQEQGFSWEMNPSYQKLREETKFIREQNAEIIDRLITYNHGGGLPYVPVGDKSDPPDQG